MIAKMNKTEKSAKILKRKKIIVFIIRITPKSNQHMCIVTLMTSQGSETVTAMFWQNGITVITRAR